MHENKMKYDIRWGCCDSVTEEWLEERFTEGHIIEISFLT